ncbi:hypothetical protein [Actinokineospora pegani]|uniref:hypothetical protein n=1 Tax=Actinokineospora pegani TaxID=2654637 RepID=UPI0012EACB5C|nr:hypothetical protein [Actinokineospora pegani]
MRTLVEDPGSRIDPVQETKFDDLLRVARTAGASLADGEIDPGHLDDFNAVVSAISRSRGRAVA